MTGEPVGDTDAPASVLDLPAIERDVAGTTYTFRCPKITVWVEFAVPAAGAVTDEGRMTATIGSMIMFLHAALAPEDSEALHRRKYDQRDPLDAPDLVGAFRYLIDTWGPQIKLLADRSGIRLDLPDPDAQTAPMPRAGRRAAARKTPAKAPARRAR